MLRFIDTIDHSTWFGKCFTRRYNISRTKLLTSWCGWHSREVSCGSAGSHTYSGRDCANDFKSLVTFSATFRSFCCSGVSCCRRSLASCAAANAPISNHSVNMRGRDSYTCLCPYLRDVA